MRRARTGFVFLLFVFDFGAMTSDGCAPTLSAYNRFLRILNPCVSHGGVASAAWRSRLFGVLVQCMLKRMIWLDNAFQVARHMTNGSVHRVLRDPGVVVHF